MAEFVEYRAEGMIPELEQLEHIRLFEKREIRYGFIPICIQFIRVSQFCILRCMQELLAAWKQLVTLSKVMFLLVKFVWQYYTFQLFRYFMLGDENSPLYGCVLCVVDCYTYVVTVRYFIYIKTTRERKRFSAKGSRKVLKSEFTLKNVFVMSHICQ